MGRTLKRRRLLPDSDSCPSDDLFFCRSPSPEDTLPQYDLVEAIHMLDNKPGNTLKRSYSQRLLLQLAEEDPAIATKIRRSLHKHKGVDISFQPYITGVNGINGSIRRAANNIFYENEDWACSSLYCGTFGIIKEIVNEAGRYTSSFATKESALRTLIKLAQALLNIKDETLQEYAPSYLACNKSGFRKAVRRIFFTMNRAERREMCRIMWGKLTLLQKMDQLGERLNAAGFITGLGRVVEHVRISLDPDLSELMNDEQLLADEERADREAEDPAWPRVSLEERAARVRASWRVESE
ncbi:uncharacterized protein J4E88_000861 [Alternaria novae-zelandiae]|uniref:uncharacterized protein n=1 Tax=Alternaria novae-zelandiae TaxID=430562 RepID=UPI0020C2E553|nr:uncharacterized protein J4E88_000861 [Alternaria novae-zelandiae]KAI4696683.1 hypothetical protein J4E88_000861 [Alternaria novae-zelandiae]